MRKVLWPAQSDVKANQSSKGKIGLSNSGKGNVEHASRDRPNAPKPRDRASSPNLHVYSTKPDVVPVINQSLPSLTPVSGD